jgi:hypothetical protein
VELSLNFPDKYKIRRLLFWLIIAILFAAPTEVFHLLLGVLHTLFEWIETALDFIIDVVFDTKLHSTQIVVFYIMIGAIFYGFYRLWKGIPRFYGEKKQQLLMFFSDEIASILAYWQASVGNKVKLLSAAAGLIFLLFI